MPVIEQQALNTEFDTGNRELGTNQTLSTTITNPQSVTAQQSARTHDGAPLIRIRGLTKLYRMGDSVVRALDGVDLDIFPGEFVAITGASGSGKSTMMHLLGCLDRPTGGSYYLNGRDVSNFSDGDLASIRNREIGFVFQTFNLINRTSAIDNVGVPLFYARQGNTRGPARKALERVGLDKRAGHRPNELSGGERQRVAIARAIVNNPTFILADEPTGNLDSKTGEQIMQIFHELNKQGVTIVLVTHEPDVAAQARRIVQMRDGKIVMDRPTAEMRDEFSSGAGRPQMQLANAGPASSPPPAISSGIYAPAPSDAVKATPIASTDARTDFAHLTARMAPGATATLVCGLTALFSCIGAMVCGYVAQANMPKDYVPGQPLPLPLMSVALGSVLLLLLMFVFGLVAFFFGRGVRRRIRQEPGNWLGDGRARWGGWIGLLSIVFYFTVPVVIALVQGKFGKS